MHISADVQRITLNASCMMISGERTEQLDIFCRVTGFMSDFLTFIYVELIWFFHGGLQLNFNSHISAIAHKAHVHVSLILRTFASRDPIVLTKAFIMHVCLLNLVSDGLQSIFMDYLTCNILNDLLLLVLNLCKSQGSNMILLCVIK